MLKQPFEVEAMFWERALPNAEKHMESIKFAKRLDS